MNVAVGDPEFVDPLPRRVSRHRGLGNEVGILKLVDANFIIVESLGGFRILNVGGDECLARGCVADFRDFLFRARQAFLSFVQVLRRTGSTRVRRQAGLRVLGSLFRPSECPTLLISGPVSSSRQRVGLKHGYIGNFVRCAYP